MHAGVLDILRTGDWLTYERVRRIAVALICAYVAAVGYLVVTANGPVDALGRPLGTDFSNVYAAGTYVLEGRPQAPFDPALQYAREQAIFGPDTPFYGWHYPPFFLFVAAGLALLPYGLALAVWQIATFLLYLVSIRAILAAAPIGGGTNDDNRTVPALALLLAAAFPAVFVNLSHGHNGFLSAALMGAALVTLDRRPVVAGVLFGLLVYKPQFGLMVPFVLAATGRWRTFAAAAATAMLLVLLATIAFGPQVWEAFAASNPVHASSRAGSRRSRLAQDPERVLLGAHVGRIDRGRLHAAGSRHTGSRRDTDLAVAQRRILRTQGFCALSVSHVGVTIRLRLRHDDPRPCDYVPGVRWLGPGVATLGKNSAGCDSG